MYTGRGGRGTRGGRGGPGDMGYGYRAPQTPRFRSGRGGRFVVEQGTPRFPSPSARGHPVFRGNGNRGRGGRQAEFRREDFRSLEEPPPINLNVMAAEKVVKEPEKISVDENVWAEVKQAEGKAYFYHTVTREVTWKSPKGPGVRIIPHEEVGELLSDQDVNSQDTETSDNSQPQELREIPSSSPDGSKGTPENQNVGSPRDEFAPRSPFLPTKEHERLDLSEPRYAGPTPPEELGFNPNQFARSPYTMRGRGRGHPEVRNPNHSLLRAGGYVPNPQEFRRPLNQIQGVQGAKSPMRAEPEEPPREQQFRNHPSNPWQGPSVHGTMRPTGLPPRGGINSGQPRFRGPISPRVMRGALRFERFQPPEPRNVDCNNRNFGPPPQNQVRGPAPPPFACLNTVEPQTEAVNTVQQQFQQQPVPNPMQGPPLFEIPGHSDAPFQSGPPPFQQPLQNPVQCPPPQLATVNGPPPETFVSNAQQFHQPPPNCINQVQVPQADQQQTFVLAPQNMFGSVPQEFQERPPNPLQFANPMPFPSAPASGRPARPNLPQLSLPRPPWAPTLQNPGFPSTPVPVSQAVPGFPPNFAAMTPKLPETTSNFLQMPHPPGFPAFFPPAFMMPPPSSVYPMPFPFPQPPWCPLGGYAAPAPTVVPTAPAAPAPEPVASGPVAAPEPESVTDWSQHFDGDGRMYYYNHKTTMSVWEKPDCLIKAEAEKQTAVPVANVAPAVNSAAEQQAAEKAPDKPKLEVQKVPEPTSIVMESKVPEVKKSPRKTCRPIKSVPVSGTPWCVVWTSDKRVFYYNASTKQSIWQRPKDLVGDTVVDTMLKNGPEKGEDKVKKAEATSTTISPQADKRAKSDDGPDINKVIAGIKREPDTEDPEPAKKPRLDQVKRKLDFGSDPEEELPPEKPEVIEDKSQKIEAKDALRDVNTLQAEIRAATERATQPLEDRMKQFREMLGDKQVSAFSTWEKELHKIVFDPRYLLLPAKERKVAFQSYIQERAEQEKIAKRAEMRKIRDNFWEFLEEVQSQYYPKLSYFEFVQKYRRDERFKAVEKSRDREVYFGEHLAEMKGRERERIRNVEKAKEDFEYFLKDTVLDYHEKWEDVHETWEGDPRFAVVTEEEKRELFERHQKSGKGAAKAKKKEAKAKLRQRQASNDKESGVGMETEAASRTEEDEEEEEGMIVDDSEAEEDYKEVQARKEREAASMREREKTVQRTLATQLRDLDREREAFKYDEGIREFKELLEEIVSVKTATVAKWEEVVRTAERDGRWGRVSVVPVGKLEALYEEHCDQVFKKKANRFMELLDETGVKLDSQWEQVREKIKDDPRYFKLGTSDKDREREFREYLLDKSVAIKSEFRQLLRETKMLTYRTKQQLSENPSLIKDIEAVLGNDKRYLDLMSALPQERDGLLQEYLDRLEEEGSPPPPTASDPSRTVRV